MVWIGVVLADFELVKNFWKVLTCIDGQRVILKLFLVNRLGCNLVYNSHNPDRFIITRVKFWFLSKNHHRRWLKNRLFSKEPLGSPTYLSNRTWKTFNSRLPGGILMPLAMIHLTYLSELCFKNDFMVFMIYIRIKNIRFEPKKISYFRFLFSESADVLIDIQNHKSWPHIWNPIPYIMSIRTLKYTKDTHLV